LAIRTKALEWSNKRLEARRVFLESDTRNAGRLEASELGVAMERMGLINPGPAQLARLARELEKLHRDNAPTETDPLVFDRLTKHGGRNEDRMDAGGPARLPPPQVFLDAWLPFYHSSARLAMKTEMGRMVMDKTFSPPRRVDPQHAARFEITLRRIAQRENLKLPSKMNRRLIEIGALDESTRAGRAAGLGIIRFDSCDIRDVHTRVITHALQSVPIAQRLVLKGNRITDAGAENLIKLLDSFKDMSCTFFGAGGSGEVADTGLDFLTGFASGHPTGENAPAHPGKAPPSHVPGSSLSHSEALRQADPVSNELAPGTGAASPGVSVRHEFVTVPDPSHRRKNDEGPQEMFGDGDDDIDDEDESAMEDAAESLALAEATA